MQTHLYTPDDYVVTQWSGGTTTQLAIFPEQAQLAQRDFIWRISSARFTGTESTFSDFSGYQRFLLPLVGTLKLTHHGIYQRTLRSFEHDYFSGSWHTDAINSTDCVDFNFIVREGYAAQLTILYEEDAYVPHRNSHVLIYASCDCDLTISHREEQTFHLLNEQLLSLQTDDATHLIRAHQACYPLVVCEIGLV